jgi:hypothetical protein
VLRWSRTTVREIEAIRDRIMTMCGTHEALIPVDYGQIAAEVGIAPRTMQWRKPLTIEEVNRMAPTVEARERKGRP